MKRIHSVEGYFELLKMVKKANGRLITNSYMSYEAIERYIELRRLYYLEQEKGILFISDEEKYYRGFYWIEEDSDIKVSELDKPIAIRNIYKEGKKKKALVCLEERLKTLGFDKEYVAVEMCVPLEKGEFIAKQKGLYERVLKKSKCHIAFMKAKDIDKMLTMRETEEFHVYNFDYRTREEYCTEIANKQYLAVYTNESEMFACIYTEKLMSNMTGDGICVDKRYRQTYGLGAALMCYVLDTAINVHKQRYVSWCETDNINSMKFHRSIGFENTGKISEEWILN